MKTFKLFWNTHKWTGLTFSVILAISAVTGFLLLIKKKVDWIQPPTISGGVGTGEGNDLKRFITNQKLFEIVFAQDHPEFQSLDDIDRVDFRPGKRVFKVRSSSLHEMQIDAITGEVLGIAYRRSDFIEQIHDGSFFAKWFHEWIMPVVSCGLLFLTFSGWWLWLEPKYRRRKRKRRQRAAAMTDF